MPINRPRILAIDPSTRRLGVAVLYGFDLQYYGVKIVRSQRSPQVLLQAVTSIIERLIIEYRPDALAIEKVVVIQTSEAMLALVADRIKVVAAEAGLPVYEFS